MSDDYDPMNITDDECRAYRLQRENDKLHERSIMADEDYSDIGARFRDVKRLKEQERTARQMGDNTVTVERYSEHTSIDSLRNTDEIVGGVITSSVDNRGLFSVKCDGDNEDREPRTMHIGALYGVRVPKPGSRIVVQIDKDNSIVCARHETRGTDVVTSSTANVPYNTGTDPNDLCGYQKFDIDAYQAAAVATMSKEPDDFKTRLAICALGLAGEGGEVADHVKKHLGHGHDLDLEKVKKECGDVLWYVAVMSHVLGFRLSDVTTANVVKLRKRYPEGFSFEASRNRKPGDE